MHPIKNLEVKIAVKAIMQQITKWGPTAVGIVAVVSTFLSPSVDAAVKAHPQSLAWAVVAGIVAHFMKSPLAK
jgi:hypothetical protein